MTAIRHSSLVNQLYTTQLSVPDVVLQLWRQNPEQLRPLRNREQVLGNKVNSHSY